MSVIGVVTTSSPGMRRNAASAACIAAEPFAQAIACWRPSHSAKRRSKAATNVPRVEFNVPLRTATAARAASSSPSVRPLWSPSLGRAWARLAAGAHASAGAARNCAMAGASRDSAAAYGVPGDFVCSAWASTSGSGAVGPASQLAPANTSSGRAVADCRTTHGTPSAAASSWCPALSVTIKRARWAACTWALAASSASLRPGGSAKPRSVSAGANTVGAANTAKPCDCAAAVSCPSKSARTAASCTDRRCSSASHT